MFYSFDLHDFGITIRKIRKKCGLSQFKVKNKTGINEDTLRKLENGLVIPKYETLEILSSIYKCDLLKELQSCRTDQHFYKYYIKMDRIIANSEFSLIGELILEFNETIKSEIPSILINNDELEQFELFLSAIIEYSSKDNYNCTKAEQLLIDALKLTINEFEISRFSESKYNVFEIRILLLLGLVKEKTGDLLLSTSVFLFILEYLIDGNDTDCEVQKIILKIYSNISYNYHKADNHILALKYADKGIEYAINNSNMCFLYLLYGRKGIAEFLLGSSCYLDSVKKSIHLLEINKQYNLAELYKNTYYEKYKIRL